MRSQRAETRGAQGRDRGCFAMREGEHERAKSQTHARVGEARVAASASAGNGEIAALFPFTFGLSLPIKRQ